MLFSFVGVELTSGQKVAISLLTTILLFVAFAVAAFSASPHPSNPHSMLLRSGLWGGQCNVLHQQLLRLT